MGCGMWDVCKCTWMWDVCECTWDEWDVLRQVRVSVRSNVVVKVKKKSMPQPYLNAVLCFHKWQKVSIKI